MTPKLTVRKAEKEDLKSIAALEKECFAHPWQLCDLLDSYLGCVSFLVADQGGEIVGYLGVQISFDEGFITNVAVTPSRRKKGVGRALMAGLLAFGARNHLKTLSLEVRPSNAAAIALYESVGFSAAGRRKNFYTDPREDALILNKTVNSQSAAAQKNFNSAESINTDTNTDTDTDTDTKTTLTPDD